MSMKIFVKFNGDAMKVLYEESPENWVLFNAFHGTETKEVWDWFLSEIGIRENDEPVPYTDFSFVFTRKRVFYHGKSCGMDSYLSICSSFSSAVISGSKARQIFKIFIGIDFLEELKVNIFESEKGNLINNEESVAFDSIQNPSHYTKDRIYEPRKVIEDWKLGFNLGNALKYISRAGRKGDAKEDLKKAKQYIDFELEKISYED